jgi:hypothetical protein
VAPIILCTLVRPYYRYHSASFHLPLLLHLQTMHPKPTTVLSFSINASAVEHLRVVLPATMFFFFFLPAKSAKPLACKFLFRISRSVVVGTPIFWMSCHFVYASCPAMIGCLANVECPTCVECLIHVGCPATIWRTYPCWMSCHRL